MKGYDLSRTFCNWAFENPEKIKPIHYAIYFFAIEHCNRLGWKDKFGFPSQMVMDAIGVKKWHTYIKALNDLCDWKFIKIIQKSKNQYSSNIICLVSAMPKKGEALDKALAKHGAKHGTKQGQYNKTSKQETNKPLTEDERKKVFVLELQQWIVKYPEEMLKEFGRYYTEVNKSTGAMRFEEQEYWTLKNKLANWYANNKEKYPTKQPTGKYSDVGW